MKISALLAAAFALFLLPARADAQVTLQIENGLVTLDAQNVPVRQILAEWARIGGARIVNAEKIAGAPVTLQLRGMPERQAIDTILRGVSGYMLASRQPDAPGVSGFDRILILPTSSAPRAAVAPARAAFPRARPMPVPVSVEPVDEIVEEEGGEAMGLEPDVDMEVETGEEVVQPQPGFDPRMQRRLDRSNPMNTQGAPFGSPSPFPGPPPQQELETEPGEENAPPMQVVPGNPFGVPGGGSTMPGVITPVPQQDPRQPQTTRPPRPPR